MEAKDRKEVSEMISVAMEEAKKECKEDNEKYFQLIRGQLIEVFDARKVSELIMDQKKVSLERHVVKTIKTTVNGKIDEMKDSINELSNIIEDRDNKIDNIVESIKTHVEYHKTDERKWGIVKHMTEQFEKSPLWFSFKWFIIVGLFTITVISDFRHPIIKYLAELIGRVL